MAMEGSQAAFRVEYHDKASGIVTTYNLSLYADGTISMFDLDARRNYLKRSAVPERISLSDFYIGATVVVCARPLVVVDYADDATRRRFAATRGTALLLVKPDAYHDMGKVLTMVHNSGLEVGRLRMVKFSEADAHEFLSLGSSAAAHAGAPPGAAGGGVVNGSGSAAAAGSQSGIAAHLASDHMLAVEVTGDDVVSALHVLAGPANPADAREAAPDSIRAVLGKDKQRNAVHVSASPAAASAECAWVFDRKYPYTAVATHCAVLVIKPHSVTHGDVGAIVDRILAAGLEVSAVRSVRLTRNDAADYLEAYRTVVPEFERWIKELASGPAVVMEVRGDEVVQALRELAGPYDPVIARALRPETLRAAYGVDSVCNAVHVTDLPDDGPLEVKYFFTVVE